MSSRRWGILAALAMAAFVVLLALGGGGDDGDGSNALLGRRVPAVAGASLNLSDPGGEAGLRYDIDAQRGRWVLVNFFATWCPPCIAEHPELVALQEWGDATGALSVVSVVFDDSADNVAEFFAERGGDWPVIDDSTIAVDFQISQIPESFLVDPDGVVVAHLVGGIEAEQVLEMMGVTE